MISKFLPIVTLSHIFSAQKHQYQKLSSMNIHETS